MSALQNMIITHQLPGRIRVAIPALYRNPSLCHHIEQLLAVQQGVREAKANPRTGRLLTIFNHKQMSAAALHQLLQHFFASHKIGSRLAPQAERTQERTSQTTGARQCPQMLINDHPPRQLYNQFLHVGIIGALLAALLVKRYIHGRSARAISPVLFHLTAAVTLIAGYPVLRNGLAHLSRKGRVDHNLIISIATLILLAMRENITGLTILWLLHVSALCQMTMLASARRSIHNMIAEKQRDVWGAAVQGAKEKGAVQQRIIAQQAGQRAAARQLQLVRQAECVKAPIAGLADRYVQRLVPITLGLAGLVYFLTRDVQRTLAMLIIGCPAAVSLSIQTALGMAVGKAAAEGILVKHPGALEEVAQIDTVLFDNTGILKLSQPQITEIVPVVKSFSTERLLTMAASAAKHNVYPWARMLMQEAADRGLTLVPCENIASLGAGVRTVIKGSELLAGSEEFMQEANIYLRHAKARALRLQHLGSGVIYVAWQKKLIGLIGWREAARLETSQAMDMLREEGVAHIGLITGDTFPVSDNVVRQLGITESWRSCSPAEKAAAIERLQQTGRRVAVISDGIDDAPVLAAANIGIAMGDDGTAAALESADAVLARDDPRIIARFIHVGKQSLEIVRQNLAISVGLNIMGIALGAARLITPVTAALIQNLSTLAVIANSVLLHKRRRQAKQASLVNLQTCATSPPIRSPSACTVPASKDLGVWQVPQQRQNTRWHALALAEVCELQQTHTKLGLNHQAIKRRLAVYGPNKLQKAKGKGFWQVFFDQFKDVMVQVLLGVCGVSVLLGQIHNALLTGIIVLANAFLGAMQEKRAEKSLDALQKLAAPTARVMREGRIQQIKAENLVPGDVVLLAAGDRVPADCRLIEAINLEVEEASLTGENLPVRKHARVIERTAIPLGDQKNMVFMGTIIIRGRAKAMVVATGMATEMGRIAGMMQEAQVVQTPLQKRLAELGTYLLYGCLGIAGLIFAAGVLRGEPVMNMLQTAVSLAVAAIPEGLAAIVLIALAMGVQRMAGRNIIVRRMASIETLGCTTVICSDKTGTITKNEMTVRSLYIDGQWYKFTGEGYAPIGEIMRNEQPVEFGEAQGVREALTIGMLCNNAILSKTKQSGAKQHKKAACQQITWHINGDPTEGALLTAGAKAGLWPSELHKHYPRMREIPFEAERRMMTVIVGRGKDEVMVCSKGALDTILGRCTHKLTAQGDIVPLAKEESQKILTANDMMTSQAMRVLALSFRRLPANAGDSADVEEKLVFAGLIGIIDPPRPEVIEAVRKCRQAGVKVVMITGDHPQTAAAIARETGILDHSGEVLTGGALDKMTDMDLNNLVEKITVYARTSPQQKLRIIRALKSKDYIVAMTGDGVNDGPAVKAADVGIAMGRGGTDVTKEAAAMTLTDDNFATIVAAMEEGRSIYNNIRKAIRYLLATNIGEVVLMFLAVLLGLPLPLLPIQLLWINLVGDGLPAIALVNDPPSGHVMSQPPRSGDESVFAGGLGRKIMSRGLAIGLGTLVLYAWKLAAGGGLAAARTLALASLSIGQFIHIFDCRREKFVGSVGVFSNPLLLGAVALSMAMVIGSIHIPFCQPLFQTVALGPLDWGIALAGAVFTAGLDAVIERFTPSRQWALPLPPPMTCQELVH